MLGRFAAYPRCSADRSLGARMAMTSRKGLAASDPYYLHWRALARLQRVAIAGFAVCALGSVIFIRWIAPTLGGVQHEWVVFLGIGVFVTVCMSALVGRAGMPCPRCGKPYFQKVDARGRKRWGNTLVRRCVNCALPMWHPGTDRVDMPGERP